MQPYKLIHRYNGFRTLIPNHRHVVQYQVPTVWGAMPLITVLDIIVSPQLNVWGFADIKSAIIMDLNLIGSIMSDYTRIAVNYAPDIVFKSSSIPDI